jgi:hypothetical protein
MRRIKLVCAVVALLAILVTMGAAPVLADDIDHDCFPFCDNDRHDNDRHDDDHDGDEDVDVDVEGPFLVGDEACVFVVTEEEEGNGDEDVDVDEECVNLF